MDTHSKFVEYGKVAKRAMQKCVLLLPEIEKNRIWEKKGFGSIYEYAAKLAGMSRNTVDEALRVLHKIHDKPELKAVIEIKGFQAVRPVATIATPETAQFWAEKALEMSKHTLEVYVQEYRKDFLPGEENSATSPQQKAIEISENLTPPQKIIPMELDIALVEKLEKLRGQNSWNELLQQLLNEREELLEITKPETKQTTSRHIPAATKRHITKRTNGQCAYPGCTRRLKILHHTDRFSLKKEHNSDTIQPMCKPHERIAHHGLIKNEQGPAENWSIKIQPDQHATTYQIDQLVMKYRTPNLAAG